MQNLLLIIGLLLILFSVSLDMQEWAFSYFDSKNKGLAAIDEHWLKIAGAILVAQGCLPHDLFDTIFGLALILISTIAIFSKLKQRVNPYLERVFKALFDCDLSSVTQEKYHMIQWVFIAMTGLIILDTGEVTAFDSIVETGAVIISLWSISFTSMSSKFDIDNMSTV